ncbi:serine hydrolase [Tenacibaculum sp.]|uniref:serine hydrolase n=1 Tax=Tenacibaculum sp. TaxID=1906242 RepID=UPI003D0CDC76
MNKTHFCSILLLIFTSFFAQAQKRAQSITLYSRIDNYLTKGTQNGFSGAISVIKKGKIIINKGYGFANKNTQILNNPNTIFDIGSNTKQFTATAILKLAELDKLKLTDSLSQYFSNLPVDKRSITIHQLLSHTAGFIETIGKDFDKIEPKQFFENLFASELLARPGEKYSYSNVGYSILGRIIELVTGQTYEAFLNQYLFTPAGMKQTGYLLPKWDTIQLSHSYNRGIIDSKSPIIRYQENGEISWHLKANGGINSTQNDMLLWYNALKKNKIISKRSFKKLIAPHADYPSGKLSYAYGWMVKTLKNNTKRIAHNGSNGAYAHSIIWFPKEDIYIVYATNANSSEVEFIAYAIAKIILDKNYIPKPIKNNVYSYVINYIRQHTIKDSENLIALLKENYADDFTNSRLLNSIGNILLMLDENIDWALEIFKINVQLHPKDGNIWDSLGDGYKANNMKEDSIKSYQKAIKLGYKDSEEKLEELIKN